MINKTTVIYNLFLLFLLILYIRVGKSRDLISLRLKIIIAIEIFRFHISFALDLHEFSQLLLSEKVKNMIYNFT